MGAPLLHKWGKCTAVLVPLAHALSPGEIPCSPISTSLPDTTARCAPQCRLHVLLPPIPGRPRDELQQPRSSQIEPPFIQIRTGRSLAGGYHAATLPDRPRFDPWGTPFLEIFGSEEGGREIRFSENKKHNFRGSFARK
jgi:hypothetical protein